ncbi:DUF4286 family protein [Paraburkholderia fungorum]|uniref:DUF4286 family protein n=1 Tax=Paraburkholderia fungorum TaxID=134537 RepID=UPI002093E5ED|nr:DUF4286 family protein [Paraburkholderia fungorum]USU18877.1 hypothetical protein NFE55_32530 [Paraburkholderia fungorum]USU29127.1 hypothetical protein NFS19_29040 [Paraburkholderia fungorum]
MASVKPHGMLFVASDIKVEDEADFNAWYDREHIEERVRMDGVISAARYTAVSGRPKYLGLYWAESISVFSSPAYAHAFQNQTEWSQRTLPKMVAPTRRIGEVSASVGQGSGAYVATLSLSIPEDHQALTDRCAEVGARLSEDLGFVHSYLLSPVDELSRSLPQEDLSTRRMYPIFIVESSSAKSNEAALEFAAQALNSRASDAARYSLTWKLSATELT